MASSMSEGQHAGVSIEDFCIWIQKMDAKILKKVKTIKR